MDATALEDIAWTMRSPPHGTRDRTIRMRYAGIYASDGNGYSGRSISYSGACTAGRVRSVAVRQAPSNGVGR